MAKRKFFIGDDCMGCRGCIGICPMKAIVPKDEKFEIIPEKCVGCGKCADYCPMGIPEEVEA